MILRRNLFIVIHGILAQSVEHLTFNQVVGGSIPPCLISRSLVNGMFARFLFCHMHVHDLIVLNFLGVL